MQQRLGWIIMTGSGLVFIALGSTDMFFRGAKTTEQALTQIESQKKPSKSVVTTQLTQTLPARSEQDRYIMM